MLLPLGEVIPFLNSNKYGSLLAYIYQRGSLLAYIRIEGVSFFSSYTAPPLRSGERTGQALS